MSVWELVPRLATLSRGPDPVTRFTRLDVVERYPLPCTWAVTGPAEHLQVFGPGMGAILDRDGEQVASGQVSDIVRRRRLDPDTRRLVWEMTVGFVEDTAEFWSRRAYPVPATVLSTTPATFSASHDVRTGARETVALAYIGANLGPAAPQTARRLTGLVLPTTLGRGGTTTYEARMDNLGDIVAELTEQAGLHARIQHDEPTPTTPRLLVTIDPVPDVSANVVFGDIEAARATAFVTDLEYSISAPDLTRAIVFAAGELEARDAAIFADTDAETLWGRRREALVDQRQTGDPAQITDAGTRALADGASPVSVRFSVTDSEAVKHGRDYAVGSKVGIELTGIPEAISDNTVREVMTTVIPGKPDARQVAVGTPGATVRDTQQVKRLASALRRIAQLERGL